MPQCLSPWTLTVDGKQHRVPCSKCVNCYKRRVSAWSFRLMQEGRISKSSSFLTLTYDTEKVPITENGFMTIRKRDLQLFMKRLRKENKHKLKYYACGEYGGKTGRPHYHMILFNADINTIQKAWNNGQIHYGNVQEASIGYTLKYMCKTSKIPQHNRDDREKEFAIMSKFIGINYINDKMIQWHKNKLVDRLYCTIEDGKKITMPRYYKDKMYTDIEREIIKNHHQELMQQQTLKQFMDNDPTDLYRSKLTTFIHQQTIMQNEKQSRGN